MRAFACAVGLLLAGTPVVAQSHEKPAPVAVTTKTPVAAVPAAIIKAPAATATAPSVAAASGKPAGAPPAHVPVATPVKPPIAGATTPPGPAAAKPSVSTAAKPLIPETRHAPVVEPAKGQAAPAKVTNQDAELIRVAKAMAAGFAAAAPAARAAAARASALAEAAQSDAPAAPRRQTAAKPGPRYLVQWPDVDVRWQLGWAMSTPTSVRLAWPVDDTVALR